MSALGISNAVDLFMQQANEINSLWGIFVAASFAAAGFGVSSAKPSRATIFGVTLAYLGFAYGHGSLVYYAIQAHQALKEDILKAVAAGDAGQFKLGVASLADTADRMQLSFFFHTVVDLAVVLALWSKPLEAHFRRERQAAAAS